MGRQTIEPIFVLRFNGLNFGGDAEDHELAWYAPQELPFLLELL